MSCLKNLKMKYGNLEHYITKLDTEFLDFGTRLLWNILICSPSTTLVLVLFRKTTALYYLLNFRIKPKNKFNLNSILFPHEPTNRNFQ